MTQELFTPEGRSILTQIYEGMTVYDRQGEKIGTVKRVYLGAVGAEDEERGLGAATTAASETQESSLLEDFAKAFAPDPLPEVLRNRLLRHGFIRIDSTGLFATDRYALPQQIASVADDRVILQVTRDELIKR